MTNSIIQEVRKARAEVAEEFGYDRARFWAWVREQEAKEHATSLPAPEKRSRETAPRRSPAAKKKSKVPAVAAT